MYGTSAALRKRMHRISPRHLEPRIHTVVVPADVVYKGVLDFKSGDHLLAGIPLYGLDHIPLGTEIHVLQFCLYVRKRRYYPVVCRGESLKRNHCGNPVIEDRELIVPGLKRIIHI